MCVSYIELTLNTYLKWFRIDEHKVFDTRTGLQIGEFIGFSPFHKHLLGYVDHNRKRLFSVVKYKPNMSSETSIDLVAYDNRYYRTAIGREDSREHMYAKLLAVMVMAGYEHEIILGGQGFLDAAEEGKVKKKKKALIFIVKRGLF
ncbi:MAG: hypothetical protein OIF50_06240 [Flavobacteriaceae bacterium]|nr:hypothetical protein [Flavobacteriaceae bacterium]